MQSASGRRMIIGSFFLSAYSLLLLNWASYDPRRGSVALAYVTSALFWAGLAAGVIGSVALCRGAARRAARDTTWAGQGYAAARIGLLTFRSGPGALAAELAFAVSAAAELLAVLRVLLLPAFLEYFFISTLLFGFEMHCLLNGRAYIYAKRASLATTERNRADR